MLFLQRLVKEFILGTDRWMCHLPLKCFDWFTGNIQYAFQSYSKHNMMYICTAVQNVRSPVKTRGIRMNEEALHEGLLTLNWPSTAACHGIVQILYHYDGTYDHILTRPFKWRWAYQLGLWASKPIDETFTSNPLRLLESMLSRYKLQNKDMLRFSHTSFHEFV